MITYKPSKAEQIAAYQRLISQIDADVCNPKHQSKITGCVYDQKVNGNVNRCAIGALLTEAQLAHLREGGMDGDSVDQLAKTFGKANIQKATGLTMRQARELQLRHDHLAGSDFGTEHLKRYCNDRIARLRRSMK